MLRLFLRLVSRRESLWLNSVPTAIGLSHSLGSSLPSPFLPLFFRLSSFSHPPVPFLTSYPHNLFSPGHKLGATYSIPHGICSCLTLPPTLLLLSSTLPPSSWGLVSLASALAYIPSSYHPTDQLPPTTVTSEENTLRADAWKVGKAVEKLVDELGLGVGKFGRDYGVKKEELGGLAEAAMKGLEGWEGMPGWEEVEREVLGRIY